MGPGSIACRSALSPAEEKRLLKALDSGKGRAAERDRILFRLMLATGIRVGSAVAITVDDVDLERREIRLRSMKGGGEDVVYIPAAMASRLKRYISNLGHGPLFIGQRGAALTTRQAQRRLKFWAQKAGIKRATPHALRHTMAMRLLEETGDLLLVQRALHHRSIVSTTVYARASDRRLRAAIEGAAGHDGAGPP